MSVKLRVMSDLHLDHRKAPSLWLEGLPRVESDAVVVAGDLSDGAHLYRSLEVLCRWAQQPVIYVPGNHDYWGGPELARQAMWSAENRYSNLRCLVRETTMIGSAVIAGATGWYTGEAIPADRRILGPGTTDWINDQAEEDWMFLQGVLDADVIVTHHLPHWGSCDKRFPSHHGFYAEHLLDLVGTTHSWIHGHTHSFQRYQVGDTLVVCNPAGYPMEFTGWCEDFVLEVGL